MMFPRSWIQTLYFCQEDYLRGVSLWLHHIGRHMTSNSHIIIKFFLFLRTFKFYPLSKFQQCYNNVINCWTLDPQTLPIFCSKVCTVILTSPYFPSFQHWQPLLYFLFLWAQLFKDSIYKWYHAVFVFLCLVCYILIKFLYSDWMNSKGLCSGTSDSLLDCHYALQVVLMKLLIQR